MEATAKIRDVRGDVKIVGVFGYPVEHSRSPTMHNAAFAAQGLPFLYLPFSVKPENLETALRSLPALGIVGVNLTIPHKERAVAFVDELTPVAAEVGAVNTVHCVEGGRLIGDSTDGFGFMQPLKLSGLEIKGRKAIIIGAGGAARSIAFQLARDGAHLAIWNRTPDRALELVAALNAAGHYAVESVRQATLEKAVKNADLLVHSTSAGMHPNSSEMAPAPVEALHKNLTVYDLIYNPLETRLLKEARERGCRTINGVGMLAWQGAKSYERWTGLFPPVDVMEAAILQGLKPK